MKQFLNKVTPDKLSPVEVSSHETSPWRLRRTFYLASKPAWSPSCPRQKRQQWTHQIWTEPWMAPCGL